jgi:hypothetical protein
MEAQRAWVPVRSWPVRNLGSEFAEVDLATSARKASVVLEVEQYRNNIVGDVENISPSPCRIKKATEGGGRPVCQFFAVGDGLWY